jgi:sugar (pentulose or hexulose) kinase
MIVQVDPAAIAELLAQVVPCPLVPMPKNEESALAVIAIAFAAARFSVSVPLFFNVIGSVAVRLTG